MKNKLHILSLALLGIYSLVLLHNVVPHIHFADSSVEAAYVNETHDHHHGDHHHSQEHGSDWLDLLLGLFGDTSHQDLGAGHFDNFIAQNNVKVDAGTMFTLTTIVHALFDVSIAETEVVRPSADPPPLLYKSSFPSSAPQRGPPNVA